MVDHALTQCRICENKENNKIFNVKEMNYGYRDIFNYFECSSCGCLQIEKVPDDLSKYYGKDYYSFQKGKGLKHEFTQFLESRRDKYALLNEGVLGRIIYNQRPNSFFSLLSKFGINKKSKVLDVGCGSGIYLLSMKHNGIDNVLGVDKFLEKDLLYDNGLKIVKGTVDDISGDWDFVIFHHSFEHIESQVETLEKVGGLLSTNGLCVITLPTVSSYAWQKYGVNWVQLDAPRHFFLHSIKSMEVLAKRVNLKLRSYSYCSSDFQFWGSELYSRDISLRDGAGQKEKLFSKEQLKNYRNLVRQLDIESKGDTIDFCLSKV
jgi:SAM-dependent methyltransferase